MEAEIATTKKDMEWENGDQQVKKKGKTIPVTGRRGP
jgi:hypothetical protein